MPKYTLNLNNVGNKIFDIKGGRYDGKSVSFSKANTNEEDDDLNLYKEFKRLTLQEGTFQINLETPENQRLVISLFGMSGSGKTYMLNSILERMIDTMGSKLNKILFFGKKLIEHEKSISDKVKLSKKFNQVKLDESIIEMPFDLKCPDDKKELSNSITLFDDVNTLSSRDRKSKMIRNNVTEIRDDILEVGRYLHCHCLITEHLSCTGQQNRAILNESTHYVLFVNNGYGAYERLFKVYLGLTTKQIKDLKKIASDSRYIIIRKAIPSIFCTENTVGFLNDLGKDD